MNYSNLFPHQDSFIRNCKNVQHLSDYSIQMINSNLANFWRCYSNGMDDNPDIKNIVTSDVREYLIQLEQKEHLSPKTINKYLSYIKKYFIYLAEHNYISSYPLYTLKGHPFQRQETIIIDWMSSIPTFLQKDVHPYTIYLLTLISLGYDLKQLLEIKWDDISDKLNDNELKQFIYHNLRFNQDSNPYIFQGKRKDKISSLDRVTSITKKDQDKFPFSRP